MLLVAGFGTVDADESKALLATFETKHAAVAKDDAAALYRLGDWCRENGLSLQARRCFEETLAADAEHPLARKALGYDRVDGVWLRGDALMKARGFVRLNKRWVLREEAVAYHEKQRAKLMRDAKSKAEIERASHLVRALGSPSEETRTKARAAIATLTGDVAYRPLVAALNSSGPDAMRVNAVEVLATYEPEESLRPLIRASITDRSPGVREAAVTAVKAYGLTGLLAPYATALPSLDPKVRANAIEAIGNLGDIQGSGILIRHWEQWGGSSPTAHVFFGNQLAFIQDFDVEVAQTAFIADPMVGTLQEGSVLEARMIGSVRRFTTVERQLIRRSLKKLTGADAGDDVAAWVSWASKSGKRLSGAPADLAPTGGSNRRET